jgi:acetyl esterase/lipase
MAAETGRVTFEYDVVVGRGGGRDLKCDIYVPPPTTGNGAGVLLVHGGGWRSGDKTQLRGYGILLGRLGYTCVACEYRLSGEAKWPAQIHDVKAALRWMRANAARLNIDPEKIAVEGNSAGGHLSLMLAGTPDVAEFEGDGGNPGVPTHVAASIAFYAPAVLGREGREVVQGVEMDVVSLLMGDGDMERRRLASPVTYARAAFPPTLLMHGNKDATVPARASLVMYEALDKAGAPVELHIYEGMPHAFDRHPTFGRQAAAIMTTFLDRHVVVPAPVVIPPDPTTAAARA